jgi:hypothetical protein
MKMSENNAITVPIIQIDTNVNVEAYNPPHLRLRQGDKGMFFVYITITEQGEPIQDVSGYSVQFQGIDANDHYVEGNAVSANQPGLFKYIFEERDAISIGEYKSAYFRLFNSESENTISASSNNISIEVVAGTFYTIQDILLYNKEYSQQIMNINIRKEEYFAELAQEKTALLDSFQADFNVYATQESTRQSNEETRQATEDVRIGNETTRQGNESYRVSVFATMIETMLAQIADYPEVAELDKETVADIVIERVASTIVTSEQFIYMMNQVQENIKDYVLQQLSEEA